MEDLSVANLDEHPQWILRTFIGPHEYPRHVPAWDHIFNAPSYEEACKKGQEINEYYAESSNEGITWVEGPFPYP